ncbi:MmpS family transport accessory protein [Mycobacteroides abscessus]|uniref:MmpS family transport accessory protein n=1 Tax=Mycobacteroides abscessus TaxID=36809 RepID=UPI0009F37C30|nr:MmpS family transport accessory protein [Mycobacteroides abscessus]ORA92003.1 hypothetical protein BST32_01030 [Mycobacteroides abscessus subsp. massiliense]
MSGTDNPGSGNPGEVPDLDGPNEEAAASDSSGADSAAFHSQAYSAPESEQFTSPYVPYDEYETQLVDGEEPPPPPPTTTTPAGPRQITYSVTGSKAPLDRISITWTDGSGRTRVNPNVYIPWSITVTPISNSEIGSVSASSFLRLSQLNCTITTSDGQVLSSNNNNSAQATC